MHDDPARDATAATNSGHSSGGHPGGRGHDSGGGTSGSARTSGGSPSGHPSGSGHTSEGDHANARTSGDGTSGDHPSGGGAGDHPSGGRSSGRMLGAVFLMATAAIGPAFMTQTTVFTVQLGAAFGFVILSSVLIDIAIQLNVWRVVCVSGLRIQELASRVLSGGGWVVAVLLVFGGFAFNIGNLSGATLGINAALGVDARLGAILSAATAITIFLSRRAGVAMDRLVVFLGVVMAGMMLYVTVKSQSPVGEAMRQAVLPERVDIFIIMTIVGTTVGGYVTYAGAHRLLDAGVNGTQQLTRINWSSISAILVTAVVRWLLFLAVLGVTAAGATITGDNPAASVFQHAAGDVGARLFGVILWAAGLTSVIAAAYTSVSFVITFSPKLEQRRNWCVIGFIGLTLVVQLIIDKAPAALLILAGAVNGLILPVGFGVVLVVAIRRRDLLNGYRFPRWLVVIGVAAWLATVYMGWNSLGGIADLWSSS